MWTNTMGDNNIIIGDNNECKFNNVIIIGNNIIVDKANILITNNFEKNINTYEYKNYRELIEKSYGVIMICINCKDIFLYRCKKCDRIEKLNNLLDEQ